MAIEVYFTSCASIGPASGDGAWSKEYWRLGGATPEHLYVYWFSTERTKQETPILRGGAIVYAQH